VAHAETGERGRGLDRVLAFSDGVFAIAITLLVLNFRVPHLTGRDVNQQLLDALTREGGLLIGFVISFYVVARFWVSHHRLSLLLREVDSAFIILNLAFLALIVFLPFPTEIIGQYGDTTTAVVFYAGALCITGTLSWALWEYAFRYRLLDPATSPQVRRAGAVRALVLVGAFGSSIPFAFLDAGAAKFAWLLLLALPLVLRRVNPG
jgi:uncharacterized membrane protein